MAKKSDAGISATLATATCALLGTTPAAPVRAQELDAWDFAASALYYGEDNNRVQDASISLIATRDFLDDRTLTLGLTIDSLTGATPNGAITQPVAQTFTRPSGSSAYTVPPATLPLDDTFLDTRVALTANWQQPLGRLYTIDVGASASKEYDYTHVGINAKLARDFNQRNTTVSAGIALARDEIDAVGGTPLALSPMLDVGDLGNRSGAESKDVVDVVLGVSQVIGRNTVVQLNYSFSDSSGYLTDPYKILSVVDGTTGDAIPRAPTPGVEGPSHEFRFESRPDARTKHSLYAQAKHYLGGKVLDVAYRFMTDDWGIDSHTLDTRFRWPLGGERYLEPHLRFYTQSEADFYTVSLIDGQTLPAFASNDHRLGNFDGLTAGFKYGWKNRNGHDLSLRLEVYQQRGEIAAGQLIGNQVGNVSYPDLDAVIAQFTYRF
ncbi:MAG: DUF3570 domain-containing protein [Woeseiaceae bacterium]|nr:DUF3570 domain-containing protein [Woeseiaceae bacterium]